jgi:hypothetical protein
MQVNNNLNSMLQIEKRLEQSASALSKLNLNNEQTDQKSQKSIDTNSNTQEDIAQETDMVQEMVNQIEIPIAYTANAQIISTQNSINRTIIDIKA